MSLAHIQLSGDEVGSSFGFGVRVTTADLFRYVEFRATAITSTRLYHRFEGEAYFYGRIGSAQGLKNENVFSDYGWLEAELDGRGYIPLGSDKTSLALRGYASLKNPRGRSQIPFYDLSSRSP